jgi:serine/threonine-protein phosphatase 2A regulatory subunit B
MIVLFLYIRQIMTGSYNNYLHIYDLNGEKISSLYADKSIFLSKKSFAQKKTPTTPKKKKEGLNGNLSSESNGSSNSVEPLELNKKILHAVWHPKEDTMAIAATNNLFIFTGIKY